MFSAWFLCVYFFFVCRVFPIITYKTSIENKPSSDYFKGSVRFVKGFGQDFRRVTENKTGLIIGGKQVLVCSRMAQGW